MGKIYLVIQGLKLLPSYAALPAVTVALAYRKCVMGNQTGQIVKVGW